MSGRVEGKVGIMRTLSNELAPHRIRVNSVHPTSVNSLPVPWLELKVDAGYTVK